MLNPTQDNEHETEIITLAKVGTLYTVNRYGEVVFINRARFTYRFSVSRWGEVDSIFRHFPDQLYLKLEVSPFAFIYI